MLYYILFEIFVLCDGSSTLLYDPEKGIRKSKEKLVLCALCIGGKRRFLRRRIYCSSNVAWYILIGGM